MSSPVWTPGVGEATRPDVLGGWAVRRSGARTPRRSSRAYGTIDTPLDLCVPNGRWLKQAWRVAGFGGPVVRA